MGTGKGPCKACQIFTSREIERECVPIEVGTVMTTHVRFLAGGSLATWEGTRPSSLVTKRTMAISKTMKTTRSSRVTLTLTSRPSGVVAFSFWVREAGIVNNSGFGFPDIEIGRGMEFASGRLLGVWQALTDVRMIPHPSPTSTLLYSQRKKKLDWFSPQVRLDVKIPLSTSPLPTFSF